MHARGMPHTARITLAYQHGTATRLASSKPEPSRFWLGGLLQALPVAVEWPAVVDLECFQMHREKAAPSRIDCA